MTPETIALIVTGLSTLASIIASQWPDSKAPKVARILNAFAFNVGKARNDPRDQ